MARSSTSPSSKKTQTVHFRTTFQTEEIELVVKIRTLHQHKIEISINNFRKKRRNITQSTLLFYSSCRFSTFQNRKTRFYCSSTFL
ncbi:hypothetical protein AHAS_Ahas12G0077600 [Arachis hypogaea]